VRELEGEAVKPEQLSQSLLGHAPSRMLKSRIRKSGEVFRPGRSTANRKNLFLAVFSWSFGQFIPIMEPSCMARKQRSPKALKAMAATGFSNV